MDDLFTPVAEPEVTASETTGSLVAVVEANPVTVFTDDKRREKFYEDIRREVEAFAPDTSTPKGRDAIKSLAFKVTKCKTGIDAAGKKLTEDARAQIDAVNAARKDIRDRLELLADLARKPLTDWERAEDDRKKAVANFFAIVASTSVVQISDTSEDIGTRIAKLEGMIPDVLPSAFGDQETDALATIAENIFALKTELARAQKAEADAAELERHRAAEAERVAAEVARQAAEAERLRVEKEAADRAESEAVAAKAEQERLAKIASEAAHQAQREAEQKALAIQEAQQREMQAALDAQKADADAKLAAAQQALEAERKAAQQAEADRQAQAAYAETVRLETARAEEARKLADAKRQADQKHRAAIMTAAKEAIMSHAKIDEDVAKTIVLAITGGNIPAVSIAF